MKAIVVEGNTDIQVLITLFPEIKEKGIMLRSAQGFSNVFAVSRTLMDYGYNVLLVLDTDTHIHGHDNRIIVDRIQSNVIAGRRLNIVWMDSCIEMVLEKAVHGIWQLKKSHRHDLERVVWDKRQDIKNLDEFKRIAEFIDGEDVNGTN